MSLFWNSYAWSSFAAVVLGAVAVIGAVVDWCCRARVVNRIYKQERKKRHTMSLRRAFAHPYVIIAILVVIIVILLILLI